MHNSERKRYGMLRTFNNQNEMIKVLSARIIRLVKRAWYCAALAQLLLDSYRSIRPRTNAAAKNTPAGILFIPVDFTYISTLR